jgi:hypothetical protein
MSFHDEQPCLRNARRDGRAPVELKRFTPGERFPGREHRLSREPEECG